MEGLLLIDKPSGWTSFDVVGKLRGLTGVRRIGHAGTLDPLATGLLLVCIGPACKRIEGLTKLDKTYQATLKLGENSSTGDGEGEKVQVSDRQPTEQEIRTTLENFKGEQLQTPPAYSAIKVNGQRAYKLARKGQTVKLEPRRVTISRLDLESYDYPELRLLTDVSSGTYIRSLAEDIGRELSTGAYLAALRRTRIGQRDVQDALAMEGLTKEAIEAAIIPIDKM